MDKYMNKFILGLVIGIAIGWTGSVFAMPAVITPLKVAPAIIVKSTTVASVAPEACSSEECQIVRLSKRVTDLDARVAKLEAKQK